jgi:hypothetical protein
VAELLIELFQGWRILIQVNNEVLGGLKGNDQYFVE